VRLDRWQTSRHGTVAVLTYRREPENVLGFADLAELDDLLRRVGEDDGVSVVVLTGGLDGYFVAHADLADVEALVQDQPSSGAGSYGPDQWGTTLQRLADIPQPVVAAVNGQAWGGGFELALACLMRVASASAHVRFVEVAHGAIPGAGGTQRLPRLVGMSVAARLVLGGELLTAQEAHAMGIVDAVLPDADFLDAVLAWVAPIANAPRHSVLAAKRALVDGAQLPLAQGLALEQQIFRAVLRSPQTRALHASL
jgi:enoyl-CoA hydratase/carnithine racemase